VMLCRFTCWTWNGLCSFVVFFSFFKPIIPIYSCSEQNYFL
jgi:hypothetical protein